MMNSITGTTAMTEACDAALSSTVPPTVIEYPVGSVFASASTEGVKVSTTWAGSISRHDVSRTCTVKFGRRSPPPDERIFLLALEGGELAERHGPAARQRYLQRLQRRQRYPLSSVARQSHRRGICRRALCVTGTPDTPC